MTIIKNLKKIAAKIKQKQCIDLIKHSFMSNIIKYRYYKSMIFQNVMPPLFNDKKKINKNWLKINQSNLSFQEHVSV